MLGTLKNEMKCEVKIRGGERKTEDVYDLVLGLSEVAWDESD